jgi:hypothetical protein
VMLDEPVIDRPEYVTETTAAVDEQIAALDKKAQDARAEAHHARSLPGLEGSARAAESESERLAGEIANLRRMRACVEEGFPCWERAGFEDALSSCGEAWRWDAVAEVLTPTIALGQDV